MVYPALVCLSLLGATSAPFERLDNAEVPETASSGSPSEPVRFGDLLLFTASDLTSGRELWRTDGTAAGTRRVRDIRQGAEGSNPSLLTVVGDTVFFVANDGELGNQLWRTDGTESGTQVVKRFRSTLAFQSTGALVPVGDQVYFQTHDGVHGVELWVTDGTAPGTRMVRDIAPGPTGSGVSSHFAVLNNRLFFSADDGVHGRELWSTDGTPDGTGMVRDLLPGTLGAAPAWMTTLGTTLYFTAEGPDGEGRELWKTDGTEAGTVLHADIRPGPDGSSPSELQVRDGALFFRADTLWRTDGGAPVEVSPLKLYSSWPPVSFATTPGFVFFIAEAGKQLWRANTLGEDATLLVTAEGTQSLSVPFGADRLLYFHLGEQLWRSDGTVEGTKQVTDRASRYGSRAAIGDALFFAGSDDRGTELWRTDGTAAGTALVKDIGPPRFDSRPYDVVRFKDDLYFHATAADRSTKLWKVAGTTGQPSVFRETSVSNLTATEDALYFFREGLWRTDGTPTGTRQLFASLGSVGMMTPVKGKLFFTHSLGTTGRELWVTDGTEAGTRVVTDLTEGTDSTNFRSIAAVGDQLVFVKVEPSPGGFSLWKTDGTVQNTHLVRSFPPTEKGYSARFPIFDFSVVGSSVFFAAPEGLATVLWTSDLTSEGTVPVAPVLPSRSHLEPVRVASFNGGLFVNVENDEGGIDLWRTDGTPQGAQRVQHLPDGGLCRSGAQMLAANDALYFTAYDEAHGCELWETHGDEASTRRVGDLWPGPQGSVPLLLTSFEGTVLFAASTPDSGYELWAVQPSGTAWQVQDLVAGPSSSNPTVAVRAGDSVYLSATDVVGQRELYKASWELLLATQPATEPPPPATTPLPEAEPPPAEARQTGCGCQPGSATSLLSGWAFLAWALRRRSNLRR